MPNNNNNAAEAAVLSIWILSTEEWDLIKIPLLKAIIKFNSLENSNNANQNNDVDFDVDDADEKEKNELFLKLKSSILIYVLVNRFQSMMKSPSGIEPKKIENGEFVVRSHKDEKWIQSFYEKVENEGFQLMNDFTDFAEEFEDEILEVDNFRAALSYAEVNEAREDPFAWIKNVIQ